MTDLAGRPAIAFLALVAWQACSSPREEAPGAASADATSSDAADGPRATGGSPSAGTGGQTGSMATADAGAPEVNADTGGPSTAPNDTSAPSVDSGSPPASPQVWRRDINFVTSLAARGSAIYVTGYFSETATLAGMSRTSAGDADLFFAKLDLGGNLQWLKTHGGSDTDEGATVTVAPNGDVAMAGKTRSGTIDLEGRAVGGTRGTMSFFSAQYTGAGQLQRTFNPTASTGIAFDEDGNLIVLGGGEGTGGVVKYSGAGSKLWQTPPEYSPQVVATDPAGNIYVGGLYYQNVTVAGRNLTSLGDRDVLVAKYSIDGRPLWAAGLSNPAEIEITHVIVDKEGNVYATGYHMGPLTVATGDVRPNPSGLDGFLARFAAADGRATWVNTFGEGMWNAFDGLTTDAQGNLVVLGHAEKDADLGGMRGAGSLLLRYRADTGALTSLSNLTHSHSHIVRLAANDYVVAGDGVERLTLP